MGERSVYLMDKRNNSLTVASCLHKWMAFRSVQASDRDSDWKYNHLSELRAQTGQTREGPTLCTSALARGCFASETLDSWTASSVFAPEAGPAGAFFFAGTWATREDESQVDALTLRRGGRQLTGDQIEIKSRSKTMASDIQIKKIWFGRICLQ